MCDDFDPTSPSDYVFCSPVNEWAVDQLAAGAADEAGDAVGGSIGGTVMEDLALDAAAGMMQMMEWFANAFVDFPNVDLASGGISKVFGISMGIAAIVSVFIMFTQVVRTVMTAEGRPVVEAVVGLGKALLAVLTTLTIGSMALIASDELASGIIDLTFEDGEAELRDKLAALFAFGASPELAATLILLISLAGIALLFVLWGELILRDAAIAVLIATSPIAAVGQMSHTTKQWWNKLVSATIQLIVMKPLIAIIFAVGFSLIGETETEDGTGATDIATLLSGMLIILLAALAWPALARFMTFTSNHVGGGTGLAAVAGAGAGFLSAQTAPATGSATSLQFGQTAESRTMAAVGGRMTMAGNKSGAIGGGAMKAAGAAGPWVAGAATALRAVQRGANSLTQRMEQTAARAGIEGANPYALPGGYPGYHQSVTRPPGPDTNGEPRPGHGAPQAAAPPPPDHGSANAPTPPPPIQPPPPNPTDQGGNR
jgi:hypothetical protein